MADRLTEEEITELKEAFVLFDQQKTGCIRSQDLGIIMRSLGKNPTEAELVDLRNEISENDLISFPDFLTMWAGFNHGPGNEEEEIIEAFRVFDYNKRGVLSKEELLHVLKNLGENLTQEETEEMLQECPNNDLGYDYEELVKIMMAK